MEEHNVVQAEQGPQEHATKRELLKATSVIGGSQVFVILLSIVRTKIIALLLGPSGIGIAGVLQSIVDMVRNATSFGINFSGVKDVAQAAESGDQQKIARTIKVVRRWALYTGLFGMLVTIVLCIPLSRFSFENDQYALSIAIVSIVLFITSISAGQIALLQGLRRIKQMAQATLLGAIIGTAIVIPLYWWLGVNGIVPAMVLVALGSLVVSWYFARHIKVEPVKMSLRQTFKEGLSMAKIGFSVVLVGFIVLAAMYVARAIVLERSSLDGVGYFQAVFSITNVYLSLVLNAMLADYLPRLSAISSDNKAITKLVNDQTEIAVGLGAILVALMVAFAPLVIDILYSSHFYPAISILHLQIFGAFSVFIAWPLEVIFLAKAKSKYYIYINMATNTLYVAVMFFCWDYFDFDTIGIAYIATTWIKLALVYLFVSKVAQYKFSRFNIRFIAVNFVLLLGIFCSSYFFDTLYSKLGGILLAVGVVCYCFKVLDRSLNIVVFIRSKFNR